MSYARARVLRSAAVPRDRGKGGGGVAGVPWRPMVGDRAIGRRIVQQGSDDVAPPPARRLEIEAVRIAHHDLEPARRRACTHDGDRLRMTIHVDEVAEPSFVLPPRLGERTGFGGPPSPPAQP